jgi:transposase
METKVKIRRMHRVDGMSINAIVRETGLARNTVRNYLRQGNRSDPSSLG